MFLSKIDKDNCKLVCDRVESYIYPSDYWKNILLSHIKACLSIVEKDFEAFVEHTSKSDYLLLTSPEFIEFDETDGTFSGRECSVDSVPISGSVYVNQNDGFLYENSQYDTSLIFLIYEKSRNVYPGHEDWDFFKSVSVYLKDKYFSQYLLKMQPDALSAMGVDKQDAGDCEKRELLCDFRSLWQNYIHFLCGKEDVSEFLNFKNQFEKGCNNLILSLKSNNLTVWNEASETGDLLFIKCHETFKDLCIDVFSMPIDVVLHRTFNAVVPKCYFKNLSYLLSNIPESAYADLRMQHISLLYHKIMISIINLDDNYENFTPWVDFLNKPSSDKSEIELVVDKLNDFVLKKITMASGIALTKEMFVALPWQQIIRLSKERRVREGVRMERLLGKRVYSSRLQDSKTDLLKMYEYLSKEDNVRFNDFLMYLDITDFE